MAIDDIQAFSGMGVIEPQAAVLSWKRRRRSEQGDLGKRCNQDKNTNTQKCVPLDADWAPLACFFQSSSGSPAHSLFSPEDRAKTQYFALSMGSSAS
jgi:hypothetical protein